MPTSKITMPTNFGAPSGFRGPNNRMILAAVCIISAILGTAVWSATHLPGASAQAASPQTTTAPALSETQTEAIVPNPTDAPRKVASISTARISDAPIQPTQAMQPMQNASQSGASAPQQNVQAQIPPIVIPTQPPDSQMHLETTQVAQNQPVNSRDYTAEREQFAHQSQPIGYEDSSSEDELDATSTITCRLETAINSELPGIVRARVVMPVYDSRTHQHEIIPAGTIAQGFYDSHVIGGQSRLLVSWTRLLFPDGRKFQMGNQEGADIQGAAGLSGRVDNHTGQLIRSGLIMTMFGVASALLNPPQALLAAPTVGSNIAAGAGAQITQLGTRIAERGMEQGPTIHIGPPYQFQIMLLNDLPLKRYQVQS